jgi:hypothetical protein
MWNSAPSTLSPDWILAVKLNFNVMWKLERFALLSVAENRDNRFCNAFIPSSVKVTGHPFWRFSENRYCALNISSILIKFSPNVRQCMQNLVKL